MAVTLTGAGGLFTRLGKLFGWIDDIEAHQDDIVTEIADIADQYNDDRDMVLDIVSAQDSLIAQQTRALELIRRSAETTVIDMVDDDDALPSKTLTAALQRLIDQMRSNSDTVDGTTVSSGTATGREDGTSNVGNGEVAVSLTDADGNTLANVRAEDIELICTSDAQVSGTAGREAFSVRGEASISNRFDRLWPAGSGMSSSLTVADSAQDAGGRGRNLLANSDFEAFMTTNEPDNWDIDTGTAGAEILETASDIHRGAKALEFNDNSDSGVLTKISQTFSAGVIKPKTKYLIGVWLKKAGSFGNGTIRFSLQDSSGVVDSALSVAHGSIATSFGFHPLFIETPENIDTTHELVIDLTTAIDGVGTQQIFIDDLVFLEALQFGGPGGPYMVLVPGSTDFIKGDRIVVTITNNNEGEFVRKFDQVFGMYAAGLLLPQNTGGSETINDNLIS